LFAKEAAMANESEKEHWDSRYRAGDLPWDTGRPSAELMRRLQNHPVKPCRAIEFGCGTGSNAVWLALQGFDVTGIDISPRAIAAAQDRAKLAGVSVQFHCADVTDLPDLGPPFEFFFDRGCYHAVRRVDADGFLKTLGRITAPGAIGIVLTGNSKEEHKPGPPVVSEETIRAELGRSFEILSLEEFRFDQDEAGGPRFLGWSVLVRKKSAGN
jgi:methyl halide transferase